MNHCKYQEPTLSVAGQNALVAMWFLKYATPSVEFPTWCWASAWSLFALTTVFVFIHTFIVKLREKIENKLNER